MHPFARHRPDEPEEVTVLLTTTDGKRWRAEWVEDAPEK
jgi:hypothetical protein